MKTLLLLKDEELKEIYGGLAQPVPNPTPVPVGGQGWGRGFGDYSKTFLRKFLGGCFGSGGSPTPVPGTPVPVS